jgi:hypothetical protein
MISLYFSTNNSSLSKKGFGNLLKKIELGVVPLEMWMSIEQFMHIYQHESD